MKTVAIRKPRLVLKLALASVASAILARLWGATIMSTDAQSGLAFLLYLPACPMIVAFLAGWSEHRIWRLLLVVAGAAGGATIAAATFSSGADALFRLACFSTIALVCYLLCLAPAFAGYWLSRFFYRIVDTDGTHCLKCGYSLVGLASDRCPECGERVDFEALGLTRRELELRAGRPDL